MTPTQELGGKPDGPKWRAVLQQALPSPEAGKEISRFIDFRINLVSLIALATLLFGAAAGVSRFETHDEHSADIRAIEQTFVRQDVNAVTEKRITEWQESIKELLREHIEALGRIQRQLDQIDSRQRTRGPAEDF
jgi:hypothetical protein